MKKKYWLAIIIAAVLITGTTGFVQEGYNAYIALLYSIKMLTVCLDEFPLNPLIEISRWLGILFFAGAVYTAAAAVWEGAGAFFRVLKKDAVSIHGDSVYADTLAEALGRRAVRTDSRVSFRAPVQVIIFENDSDSVEFWQKHSGELKKAREIHICLESGSRISTDHDNVYITNLSEIRAIDYWRENFVMRPESLVLIGEGDLAEAVLQWGLLTNVFDAAGGIRYHVFGDMTRYRALHGEPDRMVRAFGGDSLIFEDEEWYSQLDIIRAADRIILCGNTGENIETACSLNDMGIACPLHVFGESDNAKAFLGEKDLVCGSLSKRNIEAALLMDDVHRAGKLCHASYMLFSAMDTEGADAATGACVTNAAAANAADATDTGGAASVCAQAVSDFIGTAAFRESWRGLDSFTRGSNYAAALHDPLKYRLLQGAGIDAGELGPAENAARYRGLPRETKDRLQETEHIRWSRYHFLNNWRKAEGELVIDGRRVQKDTARRLHADLVPYAELSEEDKEKDAFFYRTLAMRAPNMRAM